MWADVAQVSPHTELLTCGSHKSSGEFRTSTIQKAKGPKQSRRPNPEPLTSDPLRL
jgi:hypothetical protein